MNKKICLLLVGLLKPWIVQSDAIAAEALAPVNQWLPEASVIVLEIDRPEALLEPLLSPEFARTIKDWPAFEELNRNLQAAGIRWILASLESQLNTDWRTGLRRLVGGGVTFAVGPTGQTLLALDAQDNQFMQQLHSVLLDFANSEAIKQNQPNRVTATPYHGAAKWSFNPKEQHALIQNRLLVSNRSNVLDATLDLRAEPNGPSLARSSLYRAARQSVGTEAVANLFINLKAVKQHPKIQRLLNRDVNPLAALLLAGAREPLRSANWLSVGVYVTAGKLTLKAFTDGQPANVAGPVNFALPPRPTDGPLPNLNVPGRIAGLSIWRDLHGFYAAKDELFPERTSGLIFFENMMGIFFSGLDLTEEVMGETYPEIRLVAAVQRYDSEMGTPAVQVPAFAAVLRLRHPQQFGEVMEEAWQKAIGLINFTRGQKALPGLVIDRPRHEGIPYTVARFRSPTRAGPDSLHIRYNFSPSLARVGEFLILSSTDGLAVDLMDALEQESDNPARPAGATHSVLELNGSQLQNILNANREPLVRKDMVEKGSSREKAEADFGLMMVALGFLDRAQFDMSSASGHPLAELELDLKLPDAERLKTASAEPLAR